jgi:hypothetical protein
VLYLYFSVLIFGTFFGFFLYHTIITITILVLASMNVIYNYIPETNHVARLYNVATVLYLQHVLRVTLLHPCNRCCTFKLLLFLLLLLSSSLFTAGIVVNMYIGLVCSVLPCSVRLHCTFSNRCVLEERFGPGVMPAGK